MIEILLTGNGQLLNISELELKCDQVNQNTQQTDAHLVVPSCITHGIGMTAYTSVGHRRKLCVAIKNAT